MKERNKNIHEKLIEQCKLNNSVAQKKIYNSYVNAMYTTSYNILKNEQDAQETVQDAFIKAFKNMKSYRGESTFGAWLKRITINQSLNKLNQKKLVFSDLASQTDQIEETEESNTASLSIEHVKRAIAGLPDGYRVILQLYLFEGYDHVEISEILGIAVSTSKSQYHRAKKKVIEQIKLNKWTN